MQRIEPLSRRRFIGLTADVALLTALPGILNSGVTFARSAPATVTVFDPRFPRAHRLALAMAGTHGIMIAGRDPVGLPLTPRMQGVTTESLPFCLEQLHPGAQLRQHRIDRDLFAWTLEERS